MTEVGLQRIAETEAGRALTTEHVGLIGGGNTVHDIVGGLPPERERLRSFMGTTRCGLTGKVWDVLAWGRNPRPCKRCEARRDTGR